MDQTLKSETELLRDNIINFTRKLIQTPSPSGNEAHIAELIVSELYRLKYDEVFVDDIGNVIGIMKGSESGVNVVCSSHMDHNEPGDFSLWKFDPYNAEVENNDIYGVGASDAKGSIASQVYAGAILKKANKLTKGDYIVAFTVHEGSAGCFGTRFLYDKTFQEQNIKANFCVLGNATSLNIYLGQRGRAEFELSVYGRTNSSIVPWLGINAVHKIVPVVKGIEDLTDNLPSHPMLDQSTVCITNVKTLPEAPNTIPDRCILKIDRRFFPNESIDEVKAQLQAVIDRIMTDDNTFKATLNLISKTYTSYNGYTEKIQKLMLPFLTDENSNAIQSIYPPLKELSNNTNFGTWYFNTDGGYPASIYNIPTIGYAPGEERYYGTAFDKVSIENLLIACAGYASIFESLNN